MIAACKDYVVNRLVDIGVPPGNIRTKIKKSGRYEIPNSAIVLVSEDGWNRTDTTVGKKIYGDARGLVLFRKRYQRELTLEVSLMTTSESDADDRVTALEAALDRNISLPDIVLQEDVTVRIRVLKVLWDDVEAISRSVYTAQMYISFSRPVIHADRQPCFTDVVLGPDDLNLES